MWLLEPLAFRQLEKLSNNIITTEQQEKFEAKSDNYKNNNIPTILSINQNIATIEIEGILTQKFDFLSFFFGGNTTYMEIISAIEIADNDNYVEEIMLSIDSPGGHFDGLFSVIETLQKVEKPITARVVNLCASAAFAIAAQSQKIIASNVSSRIGSVGILSSFSIDKNEITITSSDAPKKAPDVTTLEGVQVVKEQLDAMHTVFVNAIALGRHTTSENINEYYGRGTVFLAQQALDAGMIDSIDSMQKKSQKINLKTGTKMDIQTLEAQHRDVYNAVFKLGIMEERDRVGAHLLMGKSSGDMETALKAVEEGSEMTRTIQAKYIATSMNKQEIIDREKDNPNLLDPQKKEDEDVGAKVASAMEAKYE